MILVDNFLSYLLIINTVSIVIYKIHCMQQLHNFILALLPSVLNICVKVTVNDVKWS